MVILLVLLPFFVHANIYIFNPLDIDFDMLIPEEFASINLKGDGVNPDQSHLPVCVCEKRVGTPIIFWEPVMLAEVVSKPFKSVLSGVSLPSDKTRAFNGGHLDDGHGFYFVHLYDFPVLKFAAEKIPSFISQYFPNNIEKCLSPIEKFRARYISELDISQNISPLSLLYTPEIAGLTIDNGIIATTATCLADYAAVKKNGKPIDALYFCSGDRNFLFPLSGHLGHTSTHIDSALLVLERMIFKQHRISFFSGEKMGTCGKSAACEYQKSWTPRKSQYAFQLLYPRPKKKTTIKWGQKIDMNRIQISNSENDFVFLVWRKRYCCL